MKFSKIIHNDADTDVLFGVALIFKNTDGEGVTVTSAGPRDNRGADTEPYEGVDYTRKCMTTGENPTPAPIDSDCWWQELTNEDPGYLHGQCTYGNDLTGGVYDDAVTVTIEGDNDNAGTYYVVLFGATTDETGADADGEALPGTKITKLGWGTLTACNLVSEEGTNLPADSYDTGTIRVDYAINLYPQDYKSVIAVVKPGETLEEVINGLFA